MRYQSMFRTNKTKEEFLVWFCREIQSKDVNFKIKTNETKYESLMTVYTDKSEMVYSIFNNTVKPGFMCLYVKPRIKFFAALFGNKDVCREKATLLAHSILSGSDEIKELGWYLESQVWKGPVSAP